MTQVTASLHVKSEIAASFPSRPDRVQECRDAAAAEMGRIAGERNRRLAGRPELAEIRDTKLGLVELTFVADTESN
jgi:hypothetical protein